MNQEVKDQIILRLMQLRVNQKIGVHGAVHLVARNIAANDSEGFLKTLRTYVIDTIRIRSDFKVTPEEAANVFDSKFTKWPRCKVEMVLHHLALQNKEEDYVTELNGGAYTARVHSNVWYNFHVDLDYNVNLETYQFPTIAEADGFIFSVHHGVAAALAKALIASWEEK